RFAGGVVGWLGFDAARWWERLPSPHPVPEQPVPTMVFAAPRTLLVFDNQRHRIVVVRLVFRGEETDAGRAFDRASEAIDRVVVRLRRPLPYPEARLSERTEEPQALGSAEAYKARVRRIKEYI